MGDMADMVNDDTPEFLVDSYSPVQQVLDQDELVVDLTHATTEIYPDVPVWAENEPKEMWQLFSEQSMDKAHLLVMQDKLEEFKPGFWNVTGSELYAVQVFDNPYGGVPWTTCTCPNGQNRSSRPTCYHSCAVLLTVLEREKNADDEA